VHIEASTIRHRLSKAKTSWSSLPTSSVRTPRHTNDTMPRVKKELIETGKLSYAYFPLAAAVD
jgi:hypothetical protein